MPSPGFVTKSDGTKIYVADKWIHFRADPGSFEATLEARNAVAAQDQIPKPTCKRGAQAKKPDTFPYCCIDGYVINSCPACTMSQ